MSLRDFPRWYPREDGKGRLLELRDLAAEYPLDALRAAAIADVNAEAQRRIGALFARPDTGSLEKVIALLVAEINVLMRGLKLVDKGAGKRTPDEDAAAAQFRALGDAVEAVRAASNLIVADIAALADGAAVFAFMDAMVSDPRWPG